MRKTTKQALLAVLLIALAAWAAIRVLMPPYAATFVLVSEVEVSEAAVILEGEPAMQAFQSNPSDRLFAWDTVLARYARPRPFAEVTWRGPDGRRRSIRQVILHMEEAPRCVHTIRLDGSGEAVAVGVLPSGMPRVIDSLCR